MGQPAFGEDTAGNSGDVVLGGGQNTAPPLLGSA